MPGLISKRAPTGNTKELEPAQATRPKDGEFESRFATMGFFSKFGVFPWSNEENQQTRVYPTPWRGVCETKSKNGRSRPRKPFISFMDVGDFCEFSLVFSHAKHPNSAKYSVLTNRFVNRPFFRDKSLHRGFCASGTRI